MEHLRDESLETEMWPKTMEMAFVPPNFRWSNALANSRAI
ncbi:hypothetical protein SAMN04488104_101554 [Algoriphagus faecimaris]|uniref:Uncharacterized protein n=1 Tax=Algoriphagus faecimaris TaxID=686796 RepID=A0A1G6S3K8_9BACT|nr:hypothetical protein SAMN04488104_101554 [Algoriphagus faecimaris]